MPHNQEIAETSHTSIQVEVEDSEDLLVAKIAAELLDKPPTQQYIYKVPVKLRNQSDKDTYEPRIVSIGPYHHGGERFNTTEEYKRQYLGDLIKSRGTLRGTDLTAFVNAIRNMEKIVREYYAEPVILTGNEFVEMMLFDGGFILELLYKFTENESQRRQWDNDPIFGSTWMIYSLRRDLVLLENQLPFIVLEKLFELTSSRSPNALSLGELVIKYFNPILPTVSEDEPELKVKPKFTYQGKHILDLLRNELLPISPTTEKDGTYRYWEYTHSATDLWESGVKFMRKKKPDGLLDITFTGGVLEIPPFAFGESWTILLPNLIALEQCRSDYTDQITSYVILMDSLINSQNDVKILRNKQIIDRLFHEEEKVATEVNNIFKGTADKYYYDGLCHRVNAFCRKPVHRWEASLKRDYFKTPWSILSVLAALILLLLTVTQTTCSFVKCNPKA
ncbi:hypothetical protein ACHQM5_030220 [Ranunculus cassubicifolius]